VTIASDMLEYESAAGVESAAAESDGVESVVEPVSAGAASAAAGAPGSAGLASVAAGAGVLATGAAAGGGAPKFGGSAPVLFSTVGGAAVDGSEVWVCVPVKSPLPDVAPEPDFAAVPYAFLTTGTRTFCGVAAPNDAGIRRIGYEIHGFEWKVRIGYGAKPCVGSAVPAGTLPLLWTRRMRCEGIAGGLAAAWEAFPVPRAGKRMLGIVSGWKVAPAPGSGMNSALASGTT